MYNAPQIPSAKSAFTKVNTSTSFDKAVQKLKNDHAILTTKLNKLQASHGDTHVHDHMTRITTILEEALHKVMQHADPVGKQVWRQAMNDLRKHLSEYRTLLDNMKERVELRETQECIDQLDALFKHLYAGNKDMEEIRERLMCCVCQDVEVNVSIACGHLLCNVCSQSVDKCPMCRQPIAPEQIRPIFL